MKTKENWLSESVECPLCAKEWVAVFEEKTEKLECPKCGNMIEPIIKEYEE